MEPNERLPRGPKGDRGERGGQGNQGNRGERGEQGLTPAVRRTIIYLVALTLALSGVNLLWTAHVVRQGNHAKCGVVETIASLPVPSGNITAGARWFDLHLEAAFARRGRELGCG